MSQKHFAALIVLLVLVPLSATHAQGRGFDPKTVRLQAKADELYREGHWERAHFIYVNELAAEGDKYSQYMAGYMCLHGKGVERDKIKASAWYRLAAERGVSQYVATRDQLLESMSEEDRQASDRLFVDLRQRYSDLVLMLEDIEKQRASVNASPTGSRLPGDSSAITVIDPQTGDTITRSQYVRRVEKRMQAELDFITEKIGAERMDADMSDREFRELKRAVSTYLAVVNDL